MNELIESPPVDEPWICLRCTGLRGAHYLTCPMLARPTGMSQAEFVRGDWQ